MTPSPHFNSLEGIVFDIQRAALHDGPGLRTVVFLKGCPLRCAWCHNPESQKLAPETGLSGKVYGRTMTVADVMECVLKDKPFYDRSGGGLTLSGGEPTVQFAFCKALLHEAKTSGVETCLDTCGAFAPERLDELIPLVDLWHFDYKATGEREHLQWTGREPTTILRNLQTLLSRGARVRLRCPIIPGANDNPEHRQQIGEWKRSGKFETVEELPYHQIGDSKYADLGMAVPRFAGPAHTLA